MWRGAKTCTCATVDAVPAVALVVQRIGIRHAAAVAQAAEAARHVSLELRCQQLLHVTCERRPPSGQLTSGYAGARCGEWMRVHLVRSHRSVTLVRTSGWRSELQRLRGGTGSGGPVLPG